VAIAAGEQEMGQRHALSRGPQAGAAQQLGDVPWGGLGW